MIDQASEASLCIFIIHMLHHFAESFKKISATYLKNDTSSLEHESFIQNFILHALFLIFFQFKFNLRPPTKFEFEIFRTNLHQFMKYTTRRQ